MTATVVRDGKAREIPLRDLVPGDLIQLAAGDMIPGDVRVLSSKDFFVSQGSLTGESIPIEKFQGIEGSTGRIAGAGIFDRSPSPLSAGAVLPMSRVVIPYALSIQRDSSATSLKRGKLELRLRYLSKSSTVVNTDWSRTASMSSCVKRRDIAKFWTECAASSAKAESGRCCGSIGLQGNVAGGPPE